MSKHEIGCLNHCPRGGGHGGRGGKLFAGVAALAVLLMGLGSYHVRHGIETGMHVVGDIITVCLWIIGVTLAVILAVVVLWLARKLYLRHQARQAALPPPYRITQLSSRADQAVTGHWAIRSALVNKHIRPALPVGDTDWAAVKVRQEVPGENVSPRR